MGANSCLFFGLEKALCTEIGVYQQKNDTKVRMVLRFEGDSQLEFVQWGNGI